MGIYKNFPCSVKTLIANMWFVKQQNQRFFAMPLLDPDPHPASKFPARRQALGRFVR